MEKNENLRLLDGSIDVLLTQDMRPVVHISACAYEGTDGTDIVMSSTHDASILAALYCLLDMALAGLVFGRHLSEAEALDVREEVWELTRGNQEKPSPSHEGDVPW